MKNKDPKGYKTKSGQTSQQPKKSSTPISGPTVSGKRYSGLAPGTVDNNMLASSGRQRSSSFQPDCPGHKDNRMKKK